MNNPARTDGDLFEGGPPIGLQRRLGLLAPGSLRIARRTVIVVMIGWVPLVLLAIAQEFAGEHGIVRFFVSDLAVHARLLVAAPLLVFAEVVCARRLGEIAQHFVDAGLVLEKDRARFDAAAASTRRLRDSILVEILVIAAAYLLVFMLMASIPQAEFPPWHTMGPRGHSWAGWWHGVVSLPLLLVLLLGWLWRIFLWTRFLAHVARLDLHLIPAHPDNAAGLRFVGYSLRACAVLGFALGTIVAGTVANGVMRGTSISAYYPVIAGVAIFSVILFCGPLLLFVPKLLHEWRRGIFQYGALAGSFGRQFERKWFHGKKIDEGALEVQDFSAATDLYQVVDNVYAMHWMPADLKSLLVLVVGTLLPFVPVVLLAMPVDTILSALANFLL